MQTEESDRKIPLSQAIEDVFDPYQCNVEESIDALIRENGDRHADFAY